MPNLKLIKTKIRSVEKTGKVTKAMEAVSAVKMRKGQQRALAARPYAISALRILSHVRESIDASKVVFFRPTTERKKIAVLLITSDKGLAGSLNPSVLKATRERIASLGLPQSAVEFFCVGRKGRDHFEKRGYKIVLFRENATDEASLPEVRTVIESIAERFVSGEYDEVLIAYMSFVSTFEQKPVIKTLLPVSVEEIESIVAGILPTRGKYANIAKAEAVPLARSARNYVLEPDPDSVLLELVPDLLNIQVYHSLLELKASEHSARMVAMKNASDKADELKTDLTLQFNKARQAAITREVSEIIGGIEAMAS